MTLKTVVWICLFPAMALLASCGLHEDPEVRRIVDAIRAADGRIETIELEATQVYESKRAAAVASGNGKSARMIVYRQSGADEYYDLWFADGHGMELAIVDGSVTELMRNADGPPLAHRSPTDEGMSDLHFVPLPTRLLAGVRALPEALARNRLEILSETETIDGREVMVLETSWESGMNDRMYVDEELGYLPRRVEKFLADGTLLTRRDLKDYREVTPGIWIAYTIDASTFNRVTGEVESETRTTIESVRANEDLPADAFEVRIPPGTNFTDWSAK